MSEKLVGISNEIHAYLTEEVWMDESLVQIADDMVHYFTKEVSWSIIVAILIALAFGLTYQLVAFVPLLPVRQYSF